MAIFSYITLILCITNYFNHLMEIARVMYHGKGRSGVVYFWAGHMFLVACILSGNYFGWKF